MHTPTGQPRGPLVRWPPRRLHGRSKAHASCVRLVEHCVETSHPVCSTVGVFHAGGHDMWVTAAVSHAGGHDRWITAQPYTRRLYGRGGK